MEPDLKLILDGDEPGSTVEIVVWHQVMLNASPYFRNLLLPGRFTEGNKLASEGKVEIPLPETNPQAMRVICDIFHLRHDDIPIAGINSDLLFKIAVLVDKFDCGKSLQLWFHRWMEQDHIKQELRRIKNDIVQATTQELSKWTYIFLVLGYTDDMDRFISALIKFQTVNDLIQKSDAYFDFLPALLIDSMIEMQTDVMNCFHAVMLEFAELVEQGDSCKFISMSNVQYSNDAGGAAMAKSFHCSSITLGNFFLAANTEFGRGWRSRDSWTGTIQSTYQRMRQIARHLVGPAQIMRGRPERYHDPETHKTCSLNETFVERVEDVMRMLDTKASYWPVTKLVETDSIPDVP